MCLHSYTHVDNKIICMVDKHDQPAVAVELFEVQFSRLFLAYPKSNTFHLAIIGVEFLEASQAIYRNMERFAVNHTMYMLNLTHPRHHPVI